MESVLSLWLFVAFITIGILFSIYLVTEKKSMVAKRSKKWYVYDRENHVFLTGASYKHTLESVLDRIKASESDKDRHSLLYSRTGKLPKDKRKITMTLLLDHGYHQRKFYTMKLALYAKETLEAEGVECTIKTEETTMSLINTVLGEAKSALKSLLINLKEELIDWFKASADLFSGFIRFIMSIVAATFLVAVMIITIILSKNAAKAFIEPEREELNKS